MSENEKPVEFTMGARIFLSVLLLLVMVVAYGYGPYREWRRERMQAELDAAASEVSEWKWKVDAADSPGEQVEAAERLRQAVAEQTKVREKWD